MIDWWLLVALNILVVTMLFHTFLASVVSKAKKKPMRLLSAKSVFNFNPNKAHRVQSSVGSGPGITNVESHQDVGTQGLSRAWDPSVKRRHHQVIDTKGQFQR